jgi:predicted acetyltransferase
MSKVLNKLSKKKRLQNKKRELVEKIQKCKKFSEVKQWKKTMEYYSVLSKDEDYDYGFLLDLISFKLKRMSNYFHTHNIVVGEEYYGRLCDTAISLLNIGYLKETILDSDLNEIYVNTKNKHRFISAKSITYVSDEFWNKYGLAIIRTQKAKKLFWKFMYHYIEYLWD